MDDSRASSWERYFITYWWVFATLGTIAVVMSGLLYLEQDTGKRIVDWCSVTCTMFGGLIGALLIVLTHPHQQKQDEQVSTTAQLNQLDTRVHFLEGMDERKDKRRPESAVLYSGDFKSKNGPKN